MHSPFSSLRSNVFAVPAFAWIALALGACGGDDTAPGANTSAPANVSTGDAGTPVSSTVATDGSAAAASPSTGAGADATASNPVVTAPGLDAGVTSGPSGAGSGDAPQAEGGGAQADAGDSYSWPSDCDERYTFRAHNNNGVDDTSKRLVPADSQFYASYYFAPPWGTQEVQGLKFRTDIDNKRIVHHWILYGVNSATQQNGSVQGGPGQPIGSMQGEFYIAGWAPGAPDVAMPDGVGLHMPTGPGAMYRLEIHYFNTASDSTDQEDGSGVEFCVTSHKRAAEAAIHWMGTTNINVPPFAKTDVKSTCKPQITNGPVHLMSLSAHMHTAGVHSQAILKRADGSASVTLIDDPFTFQEQNAYTQPRDGSAPDVLINAGDTIDVTCSYANTESTAKTFGSNTEDEMCFFYALAWPRGQLQNGSLFSIVPGAEPEVDCIQ